MLVETYEVEEEKSDAAIMAADAEAAEIIEKLGLGGQQKLLNPETLTRFPYRKMTKAEKLVLDVLCPQRTGLNDYGDGIIPIRVLQVAAHATELGFCDRIQVWHPESADIKDPVLVGIKGPEYGDQQFFMLARWGAELPSFDELREIANGIWRKNFKSALEGIRSEVDSALRSLESCEPKLDKMPYFSSAW